MAPSFIKRVAAVGIVLIAALIIWEMRKMPEPPPLPAPWLGTSQKPPVSPPTPVPAPVDVPKKIAPPKKAAPAKPSPRPAPAATPSKAAAPVAQAPQTIIPSPLPPPAAPMEWQGNDTAITHPGEVVVLSDHQWIQFWAEHHPHEPAPEVDFAQEMVIGVFAGPRPADQFAIRIVNIRTLPRSLIVDYREQLPPPGTFAVDVTVYPYHLKAIPRTARQVKFNKLALVDPNR